MKLVIISNRLPLKILRSKETLKIVPSEGGVATGLLSLDYPLDKCYIGWPGISVEEGRERALVVEALHQRGFHPVFLSSRQIRGHYQGYSNSILWPLCHYFYYHLDYESDYWESYREVNALFCDAAMQVIEPGDMVWVQDYQLMLLPAMLRERMPDLSIGYFHHIPFPSYELFRILPERRELLEGLLGADLIGFHTHNYLQHFTNAVYGILGIFCNLDQVPVRDRVVHVNAFPMGIHYALYHDAILKPSIRKKAVQLRRSFGSRKLILSVDRLDYSKGILHRLKGFERFLKKHPEYREQVSLVMIVVPSRDSVRAYADLKKNIDTTIGAINGQFSTINWRPVYYFYRSFSFEELTAMYHIADIMLVTPLRDGMNLVSKEYVAARRDKPGVLILSEMAGASIELREAVIINPNNTEEIVNALREGIEMPVQEQTERLSRMQEIISEQTVEKWARDFVSELTDIRQQNNDLLSRRLTPECIFKIKERYQTTSRRLIMLDYDGTLMPFHKNLKAAFPSPELLALLSTLAQDKRNRVIINSGRDKHTLDAWLGALPLELSAEHGAFHKTQGVWIRNVDELVWDQDILDTIHHTYQNTPNSKVEIKETSIAWHYRNVEPWLAFMREKQLTDALISPCFRQHLQIVKGNRVLEIKAPECNKGIEAQRVLEGAHFDFILAIGDDITDEDMFLAMPPEAITVKVGHLHSAARYNLAGQDEVIPFLQSLIAQ